MSQDNKENDTSLKPTRFNSRQEAFFKSEAAITAKLELKVMANDPQYNTRGTFSAKHASHTIPFVERHMKYLSEHPKLDTQHYLSNLRLMTKIKH
jgi:hypothetical protein